MNPVVVDVTEQKRLNDAREAHISWKKWGPYLSERQWGTTHSYMKYLYKYPHSGSIPRCG